MKTSRREIKKHVFCIRFLHECIVWLLLSYKNGFGFVKCEIIWRKIPFNCAMERKMNWKEKKNEKEKMTEVKIITIMIIIVGAFLKYLISTTRSMLVTMNYKLISIESVSK